MTDIKDAALSFDMEARHVIEALRSGIPSHAVGQYFSESRPAMLRDITYRLNSVCESGRSQGIVISGKYGEGKTHMLHTVYNLAHAKNMVVSYLSLSKETPMDKLYLIYQKLIANTYLPGRSQPGFLQLLENMTAGSPVAAEMTAYAAKHLDTDRLYYLLRAYLNTEDSEEKFLLQADLEGDFIAATYLKQIYRRIFNQPAKYNVNFTKSKHSGDYFAFMSHLFLQLGYQGWVILIDETELIGRLGKKTRQNAYRNMAEFLLPSKQLESVFSVFALSSSYVEDVIEAKHEYDNLSELFPDDPEPMRTVLQLLSDAPQLNPLTKAEMQNTLLRVQELHGRAYAWSPQLSAAALEKSTKAGGFLLRTKIRAAIEFLDQLYQYGSTGETKINELGKEDFREEDVPSLEGVFEE